MSYIMRVFFSHAIDMADSNDEPASEAQQREENARIFKALSTLRGKRQQTSNDSNTTSTPLEKRTWGSLQFKYPDQGEARVHAALKPFTHTAFADAHAEIAATLRRFGIVLVEEDSTCLKDVFEVKGAVEGFQRIQIFVENNILIEYLFVE